MLIVKFPVDSGGVYQAFDSQLFFCKLLFQAAFSGPYGINLIEDTIFGSTQIHGKEQDGRKVADNKKETEPEFHSLVSKKEYAMV